MIGLILKDFINLKKQLKYIMFVVLFYLFFSKMTDNISMFGAMAMIVFAMLPITALSFDEKANWDKYGLTMPVSRTKMVLSKYILGIISSIFALILNFIGQTLLGAEINKEIMIAALITFALSLLFISLLLPVVFKLGVEKGRLLMFVVLMAPTMLILLFKDYITKPIFEEIFKNAFYIIPIVVIVIFVLSIMLSISIYKNKEF